MNLRNKTERDSFRDRQSRIGDEIGVGIDQLCQYVEELEAAVIELQRVIKKHCPTVEIPIPVHISGLRKRPPHFTTGHLPLSQIWEVWKKHLQVRPTAKELGCAEGTVELRLMAIPAYHEYKRLRKATPSWRHGIGSQEKSAAYWDYVERIKAITIDENDRVVMNG